MALTDAQAGLLDTPIGYATFDPNGGFGPNGNIRYSNEGGYKLSPQQFNAQNLASSSPPPPVQTSPQPGQNGYVNPNTISGPSMSDLINSAYNSRMNDFGQQEATLRGNEGSIEGDINKQYDTSAGTLGTNRDLSQSQIDQQATQGGQRQQDALTAARRLYQELIQGGQQRFGGASSAGEAYQALTGQELQRNSQQINTDYNTFMGQIAQAKQGVQAKYTDAIKQLGTQRDLALSQAQRDFQDKLSQINSLKNQAAGDKANQQLSALQDLRNQIYNINLAVAQNNGNIQQFKTLAEQQLQDAVSQFTSSQGQANTGLSAYNTNTTTNPTTQLAFNASPTPNMQTPTGSRNDQLLGMVAGQPINPNDLFRNSFLSA